MIGCNRLTSAGRTEMEISAKMENNPSWSLQPVRPLTADLDVTSRGGADSGELAGIS